jgi:hypothetical protein
MKIPKTVKIGGVNYQVELVDDPIVIEEYGERPNEGMIDCAAAKIMLYGGVSKEYIGLVLLHEIIHGVFEFMEIDTSEDETEAIVSKLANGLHAVLVDNKLDFGG